MLAGKVLRAPSYQATVKSADLGAAEAMDGVTVVRDGNFIGVAAPDDVIAEEALAAIRVEWDEQPFDLTHEQLFDHLRQGGGGRGDRDGRDEQAAGAVDEALAGAAHTLAQTYTLPYIAHVPLEPRIAIAEFGEDGRLTVWTGTQSPFGVRSELAQTLRLPESRIRVTVPPFGSGYGGKTRSPEAPIEAARLAMAAKRPVRVAWSRTEEFWWAYFRPAGVIEIESGIAADGRQASTPARRVGLGWWERGRPASSRSPL
jgi:isoquinoline 1-oxidoreductase